MSRATTPTLRDAEEGNKPQAPSDSEDVSFKQPAEKDGQAADGQAADGGPPTWVNDAPDGGSRAWLSVLGAFCTSFCSFGWLNSIGAFQEYYQTGPLSSYSSSTISWIPSLQIFFMMAMVSIARTSKL